MTTENQPAARPVLRGDQYVTDDGTRIAVTRVSTDWADVVVTQPHGATWRKRQPLRDGRFRFAARRLVEPNDGPWPDGHHVITGECFACMVGVATGPESHGERCPTGRGVQS